MFLPGLSSVWILSQPKLQAIQTLQTRIARIPNGSARETSAVRATEGKRQARAFLSPFYYPLMSSREPFGTGRRLALRQFPWTVFRSNTFPGTFSPIIIFPDTSLPVPSSVPQSLLIELDYETGSKVSFELKITLLVFCLFNFVKW